jgi:hypothetical protein
MELRDGGRLVVVLPGLNDDGFSGPERMDGANTVLGEMLAEGSISAEERNAMVLGAYPDANAIFSNYFQQGENSRV